VPCYLHSVKQFLSKTEDVYREPFGKRTNPYPRRCVFFGTTNDAEFLRDRTGNRRFWPVDTGIQKPAKDVWRDLPEEVDQIWAEAYLRWQLGETLFLAGKVKDISEAEQEAHRESNAKEGIIREFVSRRVPIDWDKRTINERKLYWSSEFGRDKVETVERDRICAAEVWSECLGGDLKFMRRRDSLEINSILAGIPYLKRHNSTCRSGPYGTQKGFVRQ
jgi:hypothetical protein